MPKKESAKKLARINARIPDYQRAFLEDDANSKRPYPTSRLEISGAIREAIDLLMLSRGYVRDEETGELRKPNN